MPESVNPYESPLLHTSEDDRQIADTELDRLVRRADIALEVAVVVLCTILPLMLWDIGSDLAFRGIEFSGALGPAATCWTAWVAGLVVRLSVHMFFGWMLGRFLRRLNLWRVVALLVVCLAAVAAWIIASWHIVPLDLDRHMYVLLIGYQGYVLQVFVSTLAASGTVVGGARLGRRSQHLADSKLGDETSPGRTVSPMYDTFTVGEQELHEVGVLFLVSGREIVMVDGDKKLETRSFALSATRSLIVGNDERHHVEIRSRTVPLWSVQAFVDGQRHARQLFPDLQLLFKMTMSLLAIFVPIALIMAAVHVAMMISAV